MLFFKRTKFRVPCGESNHQESTTPCHTVKVGETSQCEIVNKFGVQSIDLGTLRPGYVVELYQAAEREGTAQLSRISQMREILLASEGAIMDAMCSRGPQCGPKNNGK